MKYFLLAVLVPLTMFVSAQDKKNNSTSGTSTEAKKGGDQKAPEQVASSVEKYPKLKWKRKLKIARQKFADGSYISAADYLEDVYKKKPDKVEVTHLLGMSNMYLRDYEAAEKYFKAAVTKDPVAYVNDNYFLGIMQKMNGKYEDAKKSLQDYLKVKLDKDDKSYKKLAKMEIEGCDSAQALIKAPSKIKVERIEGGVNSPLQDASPKVLKDNRIMFSSQKTDTAVNNTTSKADYYYSIFTAEKSGKTYTNRTVFNYPPNDTHMDVSNAVFSGDEKMIIYTKCADSLDLENRKRCKLYRSNRKGANEWSDPEELKALNYDAGTTTQPAFGVDAQGNDILYFVSNRRGTKGGLDIWFAKINVNGTFGSVENAGTEINTAGDEKTPFYDTKNKTLYFSSDGWPTMGGMDVFKTVGTPTHWGRAYNAGVPINSSADDYYFALDERGAKGFVVSNRVGTTSPRGATCCDDIWAVTIQQDITLKGIYVKRGDPTNTPIAGVDASMYKTVNTNFEFVGNAKTTNNPFYFPVKRGTSYKINGNKEGYWPSIDNISVRDEEERDTIFQVFYLDPIIREHILIPNVYFAFDKSNVVEFYKNKIDSVVKVLTDHPGYSVEIQGHTDSKGSDEYNEKLSMRRANEVKDFLVKKKNIADNRVVAKWFGEKQPAVPNDLPNGEDDPEGRAKNRRVEFKIIPDKPENAPEFENVGEVVPEVKTGPGFTGKNAPKKELKKTEPKTDGPAGAPTKKGGKKKEAK